MIREIKSIEREIVKIVLYSNVNLENSDTSPAKLLHRLLQLSKVFIRFTSQADKISCPKIYESLLTVFVTILNITKNNDCLNTISLIEFDVELRENFESIGFLAKIETSMVQELTNFFVAIGKIESKPLLNLFVEFFEGTQSPEEFSAMLKFYLSRLLNLIDGILQSPEKSMVSK